MDSKWRNAVWAMLMLALISCSQNSNPNFADQACECFSSKSSGSLDEKLTPCIQEIVSENKSKFGKAGNKDSTETEVNKFAQTLMIDMMRSCDEYFSQIQSIYDNGYPLDSTQENKERIEDLTRQIQQASNQDTIKSMLHQRLFRLIQSRDYQQAFNDINGIKAIDKDDYGSNLAKAYILNQTGNYDMAINEIKEAIRLSGNKSLILYVELTKREKELNIAKH